jgi:hypothetical protein
MQNAKLKSSVEFAFCILHFAFASLSTAQLVDNFDARVDWQPHPSDGVSLTITQDSAGHSLAAMRLDFDFHGRAGYAIAHKNVSIDLPADYQFSFWIRGNAQPNNLEFKLIDASGDNVWWVNQRNFVFPKEWTRVVLKKRHFEFAWGPQGGGEPKHIAAIEIVVTAGTGGAGMMLIDDLALAERHVEAIAQPTAFTTSTIDFPETREFGGFIVESDARAYEVQTSADGAAWQTIYAVHGARSQRQFLYTPESEAAHIRVVPPAKRIVIEPIAWSSSRNTFFTNVASENDRGDYPRAFHNEQSYWTVVGVDGDPSEALFNMDGALEPEKGGYSIEPFLWTGGHLLTWNDVQPKPSLARGYMPIPSVEWPGLTVTAYATGKRDESTVYLDYTLRSETKTDVTLFLAVRPFQVNPPWQFLGVTGGASSIKHIRYENHVVQIDDRMPIIPLTPASGFGAAAFDEGNIVDWLRRGAIPDRTSATDERGAASGALAFLVHLEPRQPRRVTIAVPFHDKSRASDGMRMPSIESWNEKLGRVAIELPPSGQQIVDTVRASAAYILIHRDGPSLQPGSRSYERSWIRDGSLIADGLLRLNMPDVVREYINWYSGFQYPDGKVPCCVDSRGADPVPENDSHGELIYLVAEYFRHTHDRDLVSHVWPHIVLAVNYIDKLRRTQTAPEFKGLLPASISHEGYSAKPQHSFWDDFFAAKGLSDAVYLAHEMGFRPEEKTYTKIRDEFEHDLLTAIDRAMVAHNIDYIPGCVELGDFDPTSTTIAISPGGQLSRLPSRALAATFDRYFAEARARAAGTKEWDNYTPYELRTVGAFIRLGQPQRAHELLDFFFKGQRPPEWREWAEVVWRDPKVPKFIGDMPHGWVASDYIRSVLDMFVYDRDDGALVIGGGVLPEWVSEAPGVTVKNLSTHQGIVSFTMAGDANSIRVRVSGPIKDAFVHSPLPNVKSVRLNGTKLPATQNVRVRAFPAEVVFGY